MRERLQWSLVPSVSAVGMRKEGDRSGTVRPYGLRPSRHRSMACVVLTCIVALAACSADAPVSGDDDDGAAGSGAGAGSGGGTGGGGASAPACTDGEARLAQIRTFTESELAAAGVPGAALAVVCNGELLGTAEFGVTRSGGSPVDAQTRFQWASTTKNLTAAAAMLLEHENALSLSDTIGMEISEVSYGQVTLDQLLSHTAGFPTEWVNATSPGLEGAVLDDATLALWAPPGDVWNYSNPGYSVAGLYLERVSGVPFGELIQTRIFEPANMARATMQVSEVVADGNYAHGHENSTDDVITADGAYFQNGRYGPMGGAWGSATDLARWARQHLGHDDVMPSDQIARMREPVTSVGVPGSFYGRGFFVEGGVEPTVVHHGGSAVGYQSDWVVVPDAGFAVAALVNASWYSPGELTYFAASQFVELEPLELTVPMAPEAWSYYEGSYVDNVNFGEMVVRVSGGALFVELVSEGVTLPLQHEYADAHRLQHPQFGEIDFMFWRDDVSSAASYVVSAWGVAARQ